MIQVFFWNKKLDFLTTVWQEKKFLAEVQSLVVCHQGPLYLLRMLDTFSWKAIFVGKTTGMRWAWRFPRIAHVNEACVGVA